MNAPHPQPQASSGETPSGASRRPVADVFIDGQNLFHAIKTQFGYTYPNFDVRKLTQTICELNGWDVGNVTFYSGMPSKKENPSRHDFWMRKFAAMGRQGVNIVNPPLKYHTRPVRAYQSKFEEGEPRAVMARVGIEKGIDVSMALDIAKSAWKQSSDVILVFTQDTDLRPALRLAQEIAAEQGRPLQLASAFPYNPGLETYGVASSDWVPFDKQLYDRCIDPRDYRVERLDDSDVALLRRAHQAMSAASSPAPRSVDPEQYRLPDHVVGASRQQAEYASSTIYRFADDSGLAVRRQGAQAFYAPLAFEPGDTPVWTASGAERAVDTFKLQAVLAQFASLGVERSAPSAADGLGTATRTPRP